MSTPPTSPKAFSSAVPHVQPPPPTPEEERFLEWASGVKLMDVVKRRQLFTAAASASLFDVLKELSKRKVHSLPVQGDGGTVIGMVDVMDIVSTVYDIAGLDRFNKQGHFNPGDVASAFIDTRKLELELAKLTAQAMIARGAPTEAERFRSEPALIGGPRCTRGFVTAADSLLHALRKVGSEGKHRLPIVEHADGPAVDLVTQSDMAGVLFRNLDKIPPHRLQRPVRAIACFKLITVSHHAAMAEALWLLRERKVLCLCVVDGHHGNFVAPLSAVEFVSRAADLSSFGLAVDEFVKPDPEFNRGIVVPPETTVGEVLARLVNNRQHRLWISYDPSKPCEGGSVPRQRSSSLNPTSGNAPSAAPHPQAKVSEAQALLPHVNGVVSLRDVIRYLTEGVEQAKIEVD